MRLHASNINKLETLNRENKLAIETKHNNMRYV